MLWNFSQGKEILSSRQLHERASLWSTAVAWGLNRGLLSGRVSEWGASGPARQRLREGPDVAAALLPCWRNKTELVSRWLRQEAVSLCWPCPDESLRIVFRLQDKNQTFINFHLLLSSLWCWRKHISSPTDLTDEWQGGTVALPRWQALSWITTVLACSRWLQNQRLWAWSKITCVQKSCHVKSSTGLYSPEGIRVDSPPVSQTICTFFSKKFNWSIIYIQ